MFTRDRLPEYFIEGEPSFHLMAPIPTTLGEDVEDIGSFFDVDPRIVPMHWVRQWGPFPDELSMHNVPEKQRNYFLHHPAPKGYAVNMWFTNFTSPNWMYLWYWRAVVWHDLHTKNMIQGKWLMAAAWANKWKDANTYFMLFENQEDSVIAAAYLAGLDCSLSNMGK